MENPTNNTTDNTSTTRPVGAWLRAVDRLLAREFEAAFEAEGLTRRDWRLLSLLSGEVTAPALNERLQHIGGKKLRGLIERGWVVETDGSWTLTDEGRAAKERLGGSIDAIRARVSGAVPDEDFATTLTSLEAIARELGWNPDERMPRGFGRRGFGPGRGHRRGFGPGFGPGFGRGFGPESGADFGPEFGQRFDGDHSDAGFGPRHGFGPRGMQRGMRGHGEGCHRDGSGDERRSHRDGRGHRDAEHAYERGFDAGFGRGAASRDA